MKTVTLCLCFLLAAAGAANAESFVVPPYPGAAPWKKITDHVDAKMTWYEWIPAGQSENDIHDILTEQIFPTNKGRDPSDFARSWISRTRNACRDARVNGPTAAKENGYTVAYVQFYCVGASGLDVDIFFKAIAGKDALYVAQREFRRPATPDAVPGTRSFPKGHDAEAKAAFDAQKAADDYLVSQVRLCPDTGCPAK